MSQATHRRISPARLLTLLVANLVWFVPILLVSASSVSAAQTIAVTTATDDSTPAAGTPANCPGAACSLRDAIAAANAAPGSTVDLSGLGNATILLGAPLPQITANMTISGNSDAGLVTVSGVNTYAAFGTGTVTAATTVTLSGFTIANAAGGYSYGFGSGLFVANPGVGGSITVNVTNMVFSNNTASDGAAITTDDNISAAAVTLNILGSSFIENTGTSNGGAIWNGGTLTITSSTFSGNGAYTGAAVYNCNDPATVNTACGNGTKFYGEVAISDSTFANNTNTGSGTIYNASYDLTGDLTVHDSTFSGNLPATGGSIANAGTLTLTNNIFVEPSPAGTGQCTTTNTGCPAPTNDPDANGNFDDSNAVLKLGTFGFNGGATKTLVPQTGSPALCGGVKSLALTSAGAGLTYDQRGNPPAFVGYPLDACTDTTKVDAGSVQVGGGTITVTTLTDDSGTPAGNAANCPGAACSLRDAIAAANASASPSTIQFGVTGTINLGAELPLTSGNITIDGPGITLSGQRKYRILENYAGSLTVSGVTFDSGNSGAQGGAFINAAIGSLDHVAFTNNTGTSGGAIYSIRSLTITNSTFTMNSVGTGNGGAIDSTGALTVSNSTFNNNTAAQGAGIYDESDSALPITYSTFANNTNSLAGTIVTNSRSVMSIANSTFSGNTAAAEDQDIYHNGGSLTVTNTIIGDANGCGTTPDPACSTANGNVVAGAGLTLSVLGNYGGATNTMLPLPGSSAICGGLRAKIPSGFSTDQRGFSNAVPAAYGCAGTSSDAGAVQTNYSAVGFNAGSYTASQGVAGATPQVIVSVTENAQNIGGIPLTLTTGGTAGAATGTTATTVGGTGATFSSLIFPNLGTGTVAESLTVVGTDTLTAGPFNVVVGAGGTTAVTVAEVAPAPASFVVSTTTAATETLKATVTGTPTVNEGYVSFTVHQHTAAGAVVGTPVTGIPVAAGTTANVPYTIPAPQTADTYYVVATYTDPGGTYQSNISDSTKFFTIVPAVTATQSIASKVLTVNQPAVNFTPVTGSGGVGTLSYSVAPGLPSGLTMSTTTGAVTGSPTAPSALGTYTVTVKDANNNTATNTFTLTVNAAVTATTAIPTETLTQGVTPTPFTPVTGGGGTVPLGYTISPALPNGLTMAAGTGQIAGTPNAPLATTTFTVTVTDANGAFATATFSLTVNGPLVATTAIPT
ncbi:MAG: beta strand repeat-containing protein, partial [Acidobacteriota bacterium]